jgi:outer membrane protein TolC
MNERAALLLLTSLSVAPAVLADPPKPLTLREAAERAAERAPRVVASRAAAAEGAASVRVVSTIFRPEASISTTPGYSVGLPIAAAGQVPAFFNAEARMVLYDSGRKGDVLEAEARTQGARGSLEEARSESVRAALVAYARAAADETLVAAARRRLDAQESLQRRTEALEREERKTRLDVERSALDVARARQKLLDAESDGELDRMDLRRLIGWPDADPIVLADDPLAALPEPSGGDGVAAALSADPTLRSLDRQLEELQLSVRLKARLLQPTVAAAAQYSRLSSATGYDKYYLNFKNDAFTVGASISIPVFSDRQAARAAEASARLERLAAERGERDAQLRLAERQAEVAAGRAAVESALSRRAEGIAVESLRLARVVAGEGRGEADDVDRGEIEAASASETAARAGLDLFAARARLLSLRGELPAR